MFGIIGYGYVGSAVGHLCKENDVDFCVYDVLVKDEPRAHATFNNLTSLVNHVEEHSETPVYMVCVPTPSAENGNCDTSIVEQVMKELSQACNVPSHVVIKSTVKPGVCRKLAGASDKLRVVYCPEFLKEHTFLQDMYNAEFVLLGYPDTETTSEQVEALFRKLYSHNKDIDIIRKTYEECELFKYTINVFLSVKVWFFNEIDDMCGRFGVDYKSFQSLFPLDPRLGSTHTQVPGHDGKRGFGGKCLPKETKAMSFLQQELGIDNSVLERILKRNDFFRLKK